MWMIPVLDPRLDRLSSDELHEIANALARYRPAPSFHGCRPGWVFKKGIFGLGYYRDGEADMSGLYSLAACSVNLHRALGPRCHVLRVLRGFEMCAVRIAVTDGYDALVRARREMEDPEKGRKLFAPEAARLGLKLAHLLRMATLAIEVVDWMRSAVNDIEEDEEGRLRFGPVGKCGLCSRSASVHTATLRCANGLQKLPPHEYMPAPKFQGCRPGWVFKTGAFGTSGYYRELLPEVLPSLTVPIITLPLCDECVSVAARPLSFRFPKDWSDERSNLADRLAEWREWRDSSRRLASPRVPRALMARKICARFRHPS